tara:strand:- start:3614 stop:4459 length:846 start_codon:yes stop_codon:yes gene_type:complete
VSIRTELLNLIEQINAAINLPTVRRVYIPDPRPTAQGHPQFGVVELDDGAAGLFYAWLGESQKGMHERFNTDDLVGIQAIELARKYADTNDMDRSVGLATINAITQSVFIRSNVGSCSTSDSMGGISLVPGDRLGMVGNFPSLVRQARKGGVPVTVVERKHHMLNRTQGIQVTLDSKVLRDCNKIICTAATLINDSVDEVLEYCLHADMVVMIGPSASFFPDPMFSRGVAVVGGTRVLDPVGLIDGLKMGQGLADHVYRYTLSDNEYVGTLQLCATLSKSK